MWFVNFTLDTCFAIHLLTTYLVNPPPPFSSIRSEISGTRLKSRCLRGRKRSTGEFEVEFPTGSQARRKFNGRASSVDEDRKFNTFVFLISLACFSAGKIGEEGRYVAWERWIQQERRRRSWGGGGIFV